MMLVRQQAQALIDARSTIVAGSVSIVHGALAKLEERGHVLGDRDRARLISNMMTVLAGERVDRCRRSRCQKWSSDPQTD